MLCSCGGSNGPLLMFPRNIAVSSFVAGYLFNIAKFLSSGPSSRGELLAYAARELSTVHSCPSPCGNVSVGNEEQSYWSLTTLISFVRGFFCRKHVDQCDSVVLSQAADAWRYTCKARWWTNGGLFSCLELP